MRFNGFNKKGIEFLEELTINNTKQWFEQHRHIWEKEIHTPNIEFIEDMGETLQILVPTITAVPKVSKSLFKIYRDVRFSKDKTPIKSKIGLLFWQGKTHRMQSSSFYMHYDKDQYFIATGIRNFKPELLKTYREYLKVEKHRTILHNILVKLKTKGYLLPEPKFKRINAMFDKDDTNIYLTLYGAMFAYQIFPIDDTFYSIELLDRAFAIYEDMYDLQQWVYKMSISEKL
jgi:uncharacterized protein (TIGR02453 family)